jgi:hypothetical protein
MKDEGIDMAPQLLVKPRHWPLRRHLVILNPVRHVLINIIVVIMARPAKDDAEILVENVGCPKSAHAKLGLDVVDSALGHVPLPGRPTMQTKSGDKLQGAAKSVPGPVHARRGEQVEGLDDPCLCRLETRRSCLGIGEVGGDTEEAVAPGQGTGDVVGGRGAPRFFVVRSGDGEACQDN